MYQTSLDGANIPQTSNEPDIYLNPDLLQALLTLPDINSSDGHLLQYTSTQQQVSQQTLVHDQISLESALTITSMSETPPPSQSPTPTPSSSCASSSSSSSIPSFLSPSPTPSLLPESTLSTKSANSSPDYEGYTRHDDRSNNGTPIESTQLLFHDEEAKMMAINTALSLSVQAHQGEEEPQHKQVEKSALVAPTHANDNRMVDEYDENSIDWE
jgi:hypothetical protein